MRCQTVCVSTVTALVCSCCVRESVLRLSARLVLPFKVNISEQYTGRVAALTLSEVNPASEKCDQNNPSHCIAVKYQGCLLDCVRMAVFVVLNDEANLKIKCSGESGGSEN